MSSTPRTFDAQLLGQTEKACNAILARLLEGSGVTEPQWVTLRLLGMSGGAASRGELTARLVAALKVPVEAAGELIAALASAGLVSLPDDELMPVELTSAARELHARVVAATADVTGRLWGDLPADDLAAAGRVL